MLPLILGAIGAGGLGVSAGANLYTQYNQRKLYSREIKAYRALNHGYERYLAKNGRSINPNRAWSSYYGTAERLANNLTNSSIGSVGTLAGSVGAGAVLSRGLYSSGKTKRRL